MAERIKQEKISAGKEECEGWEKKGDAWGKNPGSHYKPEIEMQWK